MKASCHILGRFFATRFWIYNLRSSKPLSQEGKSACDNVLLSLMKGSELPHQKFLFLMQQQFWFCHPISYQVRQVHPSAGIVGRRYVFYDIEAWRPGLKTPRSEFTILDQEIFYKSMLTWRARTGIAGTMETYICSRSSWIPLPVSLPFNTRMMGSGFSFKASAILLICDRSTK